MTRGLQQVEIVVHRTLGREVFGQGLLLASGPQHIENPVQHFAHIQGASSPPVLGRRNLWAQQVPIRHRSDHLGNEGRFDPRPGGVQVSTSGALQRIKRLTRNHIRFIGFKKFPDSALIA